MAFSCSETLLTDESISRIARGIVMRTCKHIAILNYSLIHGQRQKRYLMGNQKRGALNNKKIEMTEERKTQIENIIIDLRSKNEKKVLGALKRIPHDGSPEMIRPMFELVLAGPSSEARILLDKTLNNLKDRGVKESLIELLMDKDFYHVQPEVLNCVWQSGVDLGDRIELLIDISINGTYMTVLEVCTVIENIEVIDTEALSESIKRMDKAVAIKSETQDILVSLRELLLEKLLH